MTAYADVIAALSEMRFLLGRWMEAIENRRGRSKSLEKEQADQYKGAARRFRDSISVARLLLPRETHHVLHQLDLDIEKISGDDAHQAYALE